MNIKNFIKINLKNEQNKSFFKVFLIALIVFVLFLPIGYFSGKSVGGGEMNFAPFFVVPAMFFLWFIFVGFLKLSFFDKFRIALLNSVFSIVLILVIGFESEIGGEVFTLVLLFTLIMAFIWYTFVTFIIAIILLILIKNK